MKPAKFFILFFIFSSLSLYSFDSNKNLGESEDIKSEIKKYIKHHLKDSHSFYLTSFTNNDTGKKTYIEIPMPVILYDKGFKFFMSSDFKHGKEIVIDNETY